MRPIAADTLLISDLHLGSEISLQLLAYQPAVCFGNVLGSNGSVLPVLQQQIRAGLKDSTPARGLPAITDETLIN